MNEGNNKYDKFKTPDYIRYGGDDPLAQTKELEKFRRQQDLYIRSKKTRGKFFKSLLSILIIILIIYIGFWTYKEFFKAIDPNLQVDKSSPHYVNDLYASDGRFYEKLLDENQKKAYMEWLNVIKKVEKEFVVSYDYFKGQEIDTMKVNVEMIYKVMSMDHPELFYLSDYTFSGYDVYEMKITNNYIVDSKVIIDFYEKRLLRKLDDLYYKWKDIKTDYAKEVAVYNWISKNKIPAGETRITSTATSALLDGRTNHIGAAKASQILMRKLDVRSDLVFGYYEFPRVFNLVYLDDGVYYYDSGRGVETVDKKVIGRKNAGLNISDNEKYGVYMIKPDERMLGQKYLNEIN